MHSPLGYQIYSYSLGALPFPSPCVIHLSHSQRTCQQTCDQAITHQLSLHFPDGGWSLISPPENWTFHTRWLSWAILKPRSYFNVALTYFLTVSFRLSVLVNHCLAVEKPLKKRFIWCILTPLRSLICSPYMSLSSMSKVLIRFWANVGVLNDAFSPLITTKKKIYLWKITKVVYTDNVKC
jgi:hypothetical protein